MTRRQSNSQWSGDIAAQLAPKYSECKNMLEKISPLFLGIKTASSHWLPSKGPDYKRWVLLIYAGVIEIRFEGKIPRENIQAVLDLALLTGHLQLRRNWPTWTSNVLITHHILRLATACSLDWKTNEISQFFFRRVGQSCRGEVVVWQQTEYFDLLADVITTAWEVYWASWGLCWINPEFGRCSLFQSLSS